MPKISSSFRPFAEQWLKSLESVIDPKQAIGTARADCTLVGDQSSEVKYSDHHLISDEPKAVGGAGLGPSPLDYFMASIGFCENVTFARYASLNELSLDSLQTNVRGHWNRTGQAESSDVEPAFIDFVVETRVASSDSVEKIKRVAMTAHRRCPMHSTITKVGEVVDKLFVNGVEVPL